MENDFIAYRMDPNMLGYKNFYDFDFTFYK